MKNIILAIMALSFVGVAHANLLSNGDFNLPGDGSTATDWTAWTDIDGFANTEQAGWGSPGGTYHFATGCWGNGGGGVYQIVPATAGQPYTLTVDSGADAWYLPTGRMIMFFLDDEENVLAEATRLTVDPEVYGHENLDFAHPWETYTITASAPPGTTQIKVEFASNENSFVDPDDPDNIPVGATGAVGFDNAVLVLDPSMPYGPAPFDGETGVAIDSALSWSVPQIPWSEDPNVFLDDPNLVSHDLYMAYTAAGDLNDPNLVYVDNIEGWDAGMRASYAPVADLEYDARYLWRVDAVKDDGAVVEGQVWEFYTEASIPVITGQPEYQLVDKNTVASFAVIAESISAMSYQWYKDGAELIGETGPTLNIASAQVSDEGVYHCEVGNDATNPAGPVYPTPSDAAMLGIKRELAHWSFTGGSLDATNDESQTTTTTVVGDPVTEPGILGDGMAFDADADAQDTIYTAPDDTFFDITNYNITVGVWIKTSGTGVPEWSPLVARNGEGGEGWQLRRTNVGPAGDERVAFTTHGLAAVSGGADGSASLDTAFDGEWHYVVGTYDGASRKVYVDGVVQEIWWLVDGTPNSAEGDDATGTITPSASGISIAGRYRDGEIDGQFIAGTYDEVEIWNYARSAEEIAQTYANLSGNAICSSQPEYDLDGDCKVGLSDMALFASQWLVDTNVTPAP